MTFDRPEDVTNPHAVGSEPELVSTRAFGKVPGGWRSRGSDPMPTRIAVAGAILGHGA